MNVVRASAVEYLNARPLVHGLESLSDLFELSFAVPAKCASLLHDGSVDLALIPSIEYLQKPDYRVVQGISVASRGPVASVALFSKQPTSAIRTIAVDSSSRTAIALLRILCIQWFDIEPKLIKMHPDLPVMLKRCDAALLIGDRALFTEHEHAGLEKVDLGEEWGVMTGLPFVWSFWVGRPDVLQARHIEALQTAKAQGLKAFDEIVDQFAPNNDKENHAEIARNYLSENVEFSLDDQCIAGLKKFYTAVFDLGIVQIERTLRFY
jgi:chorismate dehydratase